MSDHIVSALVPRCRERWIDTDRETHYCDRPERHDDARHRCVCGDEHGDAHAMAT